LNLEAEAEMGSPIAISLLALFFAVNQVAASSGSDVLLPSEKISVSTPHAASDSDGNASPPPVHLSGTPATGDNRGEQLQVDAALNLDLDGSPTVEAIPSIDVALSSIKNIDRGAAH